MTAVTTLPTLQSEYVVSVTLAGTFVKWPSDRTNVFVPNQGIALQKDTWRFNPDLQRAAVADFRLQHARIDPRFRTLAQPVKIQNEDGTWTYPLRKHTVNKGA